MEKEENETPDPEYLKGFNEGYTMAQKEPELAKILGSAKNDTERLRGFRQGRDQYLNVDKDLGNFLTEEEMNDDIYKDDKPSWLKNIPGFRNKKDESNENVPPRRRGPQPDL